MLDTIHKLLLTCFLYLLALTTAYGCTCGTITEDSATIAIAARWNDVVFIGEVVEQSEWESEFRVIRNFKGLEKRERVTAKYFDSCSTVYGEGYYLIYASWEGTALNTSYCSLNKQFVPAIFPEEHVRLAGGIDAFIRRDLSAYDAHVAFLERRFGRAVVKTGWEWYGLAGIACLVGAAVYLWTYVQGLKE